MGATTSRFNLSGKWQLADVMIQPLNAEAVKPHLPSLDAVALDLYGINFQRDQGHCPFPDRHNHGDRDKSLRFDRHKDRIFCASQQCFGESGVDAFGLVQKMDSVTFPQAVQTLADRYGASPQAPTSGPRRTAAAVRSIKEREGFIYHSEGYFGDFLRQVRLEHLTKLQLKGRPEKDFSLGVSRWRGVVFRNRRTRNTAISQPDASS
jgi:hypothetical protein